MKRRNRPGDDDDDRHHPHGAPSSSAVETNATAGAMTMHGGSDDEEEEEEEGGAAAAYCFGIGEVAAPCLQREIIQTPAAQIRQVERDLLGISDDVLEVLPDDVLPQLEAEMGKLDDSRTAAYRLAIELSPSYVADSGLGMAFLRSVEGGSPRRAAVRMARHFQTKLDLFGRDPLCRPIELSDLDEYDMEALESGGFQVLPQKDRGGRPILFGRYTCMRYRSVTNMVRALWYIWSSLVEDEAHQRSGIVAIGFENGKTPLERFDGAVRENTGGATFDLHAAHSGGGFDRDLARGILSLPLSLPVRPVGYHITADSSQWQGISDMVMVTLCKYARLRLRFHFGTIQETMYKLMTNGIPVEAIPVGEDGEVDLTNHFRWIEHRRLLELERHSPSMEY